MVDKSEPRRLTVHCPYERCRWRLCASHMRKSKMIQLLYIKLIPYLIDLSLNLSYYHAWSQCIINIFHYISDQIEPKCSHMSTWRGEAQTKLAKTKWVADAIMDWLRETPTLGPTTLHKKLFEKYKMSIPYMSIFYGNEMALDKINVPWSKSFCCCTCTRPSGDG